MRRITVIEENDASDGLKLALLFMTMLVCLLAYILYLITTT